MSVSVSVCLFFLSSLLLSFFLSVFVSFFPSFFPSLLPFLPSYSVFFLLSFPRSFVFFSVSVRVSFSVHGLFSLLLRSSFSFSFCYRLCFSLCRFVSYMCAVLRLSIFLFVFLYCSRSWFVCVVAEPFASFAVQHLAAASVREHDSHISAADHQATKTSPPSFVSSSDQRARSMFGSGVTSLSRAAKAEVTNEHQRMVGQ